MSQTKAWEISDAFWAAVEPYLPIRQRSSTRTYQRRPGGGRKPMPPRQIFSAIVYVLRTGCQWKALPKEFGSASAMHLHFQHWQAVVFLPGSGRRSWLNTTNWKDLLGNGKALMGLWARLLWQQNASAPTRRIGGKNGRKRSVLTDGRGVPLALVASGANVHDVKLLAATLAGVRVPAPADPAAQNLCADADYKGQPALEIIARHHY